MTVKYIVLQWSDVANTSLLILGDLFQHVEGVRIAANRQSVYVYFQICIHS